MRSTLALMLVAVALGGCGPSEVEAGQAVLLVAPVITLVGALVALAYARLWNPLVEGLHFDKRSSAAVIGLQIIACLAIPIVGGGDADWLFAALCFVGTSYLSLQALLLRVAVTPGLRRHYSRLSLYPWLLLYGPALWNGYFGSTSSEADGIGVVLWILPGYLGLVTTPLMIILLIEVLVRRHLLAKRLREAALPRPLPVARLL